MWWVVAVVECGEVRLQAGKADVTAEVRLEVPAKNDKFFHIDTKYRYL